MSGFVCGMKMYLATQLAATGPLMANRFGQHMNALRSNNDGSSPLLPPTYHVKLVQHPAGVPPIGQQGLKLTDYVRERRSAIRPPLSAVRAKPAADETDDMALVDARIVALMTPL